MSNSNEFRMKPLDRTLSALVVDESILLCGIMCRILQQIGFARADSANDGIDALRKLKSQRYGLLLIELNMNPVSGAELIRLIWTDSEIPWIPVVLTSADRHNLAKAVSDSDRTLADVYICKPFTAEALDEKLRMAFGATAVSEPHPSAS